MLVVTQQPAQSATPEEPGATPKDTPKQEQKSNVGTAETAEPVFQTPKM